MDRVKAHVVGVDGGLVHVIRATLQSIICPVHSFQRLEFGTLLLNTTTGHWPLSLHRLSISEAGSKFCVLHHQLCVVHLSNSAQFGIQSGLGLKLNAVTLRAI